MMEDSHAGGWTQHLDRLDTRWEKGPWGGRWQVEILAVRGLGGSGQSRDIRVLQQVTGSR